VLQSFIKKTLSLFLFSFVFLALGVPARAQKPAEERDMAIYHTLMPMFVPNKDDGLNYEDLLYTMIRDQGYEAHCGGVEWWLDKDLFGDIGKFFSQDVPPEESFYNGLNPTEFGGVDNYVVDYSKARIPMMRGLQSRYDIVKNSSLEGMFGAGQQTEEDTYKLNSSGVSKRMLSDYQQCLAKTQNILASAQICDELEGEECTLNKEYSFQIVVDEEGNSRPAVAGENASSLEPGESIEKVAFYMNALRGWFAEIRPDLHGKELYEQVCFDITGGDATTASTDYDPPPVEPVKIAKLREAVKAISIDLDSLYRLAFLVLSPQQNKGKEEYPDNKFYWLQNDPPAQIDSWAHAPIFIAFKIPDFGTNKSRIAGNIDTLELTKMALQTYEQNEKDKLDQTKKREFIYEAAKAAPLLLDGEKVMNCPSFYPQCRRKPENALNNVIEDMINGMSLKCKNQTLRIIQKTVDENGEPLDIGGFTKVEKQAEASGVELIFNQEDLNWERAGDLFTPASKDLKDNLYKSPANTQVANHLASSDTNPFEWKLMIDEDPPDLESYMIVNAYLVLPIGETIKDVNKALAIFWDEDQFFDLVRNNVIEDMENKKGVIPKYYTVKDANLGFSAVDSINPLNECVPEVKIVNGVKEIHMVCSHYTFGVGFSETRDEMLIPDFGLGFMVRKIQQTLRTTFHDTYEYILSCHRIEDMFLGRCSGNPEGIETKSFCDGEAFKNIKGLPPAGGIPQFAQDQFGAEILPLITPEHIEAYQYAEEQTGMPCEVVAGIHWTEAGLDINGSVFSGAALEMSLKEDAKAAMEHLISLWPGTFDKNNIQYEDLVAAIANFNGPGNMNCSYDFQDNARPTRWRQGGKCEAQFFGEDHPHPLGWIDQRHSDMDLAYCMDFIEWSCQTEGTETELQAAADRIRDWMSNVDADVRWSEERIQSHVQESASKCFSGSPVCQTLSEGRKYPKYERAGSITTAILLNEAGTNFSP